MKEAIKSIMQKENKIMELVNPKEDGEKFRKFIKIFSDKEIIVLECLMHIGREKYTKLELPKYNSTEELIEIYYKDIIIKEQKEFNKDISINIIAEKFLRLDDFFKCGFELINDPYISRNLVGI